jgi:rubrerythrin
MPRCITGAIDEGNRYLARMLTWCEASDVKIITLLKQAIATEKASGDTTSVACYWVCPTCGNIESEQLRTCYCPHCMTYSAEFLIFE